MPIASSSAQHRYGGGQRIFFLHDGRTNELVQAIQQHSSNGSEANASKTSTCLDRMTTSRDQLPVFVVNRFVLPAIWRKPGYAVLCLGVLLCLVSYISWQYRPGSSAAPNPEDGRVVGGIYTSAYFGLSYPLPQGWSEAKAGPAPSWSGYYVLGMLTPSGEQNGSIVIAAQDMFFASEPVGDAATAAERFGRAMSEIDGMTIDHDPSTETIAGHRFGRVDYSGVGLYRAMYATEIRCHVVSFNLTARDPDTLARLAQHLNNLSAAAGGASVPACLKDYAVTENVLRRVQPAAAGPKLPSVPVRIIIGADGSVKHLHVIRASPEQRRSIEAALLRWQFKPYRVDGRPVELETGLLMQ
jgi:hypothetical protein